MRKYGRVSSVSRSSRGSACQCAVGLSSMNTVIAALHDRHVQQQLEVIGCVLERPPALSLKGLTREVTRAALGYLTTPRAA